MEITNALLREETIAAEPHVPDRVVNNVRQHQEEVGKALGTQVHDATVTLFQSIVFHPENQDRIPKPISPQCLNRLYVEFLNAYYRIMLFAQALIASQSRKSPSLNPIRFITVLSPRDNLAKSNTPAKMPISSGLTRGEFLSTGFR